MGCFSGAELCELIGLLILHEIRDLFPSKSYGLYRDDGLAVVKSKPKRSLISAERKVREALTKLGFDITIESGLVTTEFLDVNLNLKRDSYNPYKKPNSRLMYVNRQSNHPPSVTKSIPAMVVQRLCRLSKTKSDFDNYAPEYINELNASGYRTDELKFEKPAKKKRTRKRNAIFFHPPFCRSVKTKIGRIFRDLISKHFTPDHVFYKIFNKNTIKISYSCLPNMKTIMNAHKSKILNIQENTSGRNCNCRKPNECPVGGNCLKKNIIYQADVELKYHPSKVKTYIGSTSRTFKERYQEHKSSFKSTRPGSKLSKYIKTIGDQEYTIKWKIINASKQMTPNIKFCMLCNLERFEIAKAYKRTLLNSRNELVTQCPHNVSLFFTRKKPK